jgi:hypothetical protein
MVFYVSCLRNLSSGLTSIQRRRRRRFPSGHGRVLQACLSALLNFYSQCGSFASGDENQALKRFDPV